MTDQDTVQAPMATDGISGTGGFLVRLSSYVFDFRSRSTLISEASIRAHRICEARLTTPTSLGLNGMAMIAIRFAPLCVTFTAFYISRVPYDRTTPGPTSELTTRCRRKAPPHKLPSRPARPVTLHKCPECRFRCGFSSKRRQRWPTRCMGS